MPTHSCCQQNSSSPANPSPAASPTDASLFHRSKAVAKWLGPTTLLVLMPKCPACLAAYIALGTGIGISMRFAAGMRWMLLGISIAILAYLVIPRLRNLANL
jgi:hypothetical protein